MSDTDILWITTLPCAILYICALGTAGHKGWSITKGISIALAPFSIPVTLALIRAIF